MAVQGAFDLLVVQCSFCNIESRRSASRRPAARLRLLTDAAAVTRDYVLAPLPGGDIAGGDMERFIADVLRRWPFLQAAEANRMAHAYGTRISQVLAGVDSREAMGERFGGGLSRAEVDFLVREEWAMSAEDIYWRHTKAGLYASPAEQCRLTAYLQSIGQETGIAPAARAG